MSALEAMGAEYLAHRQNPPTLTERQTALLNYLAEGCTPPEAARNLFISKNVLNRDLSAARRALHAATNTEAVATAIRRGLLPEGVTR